MQRPQLSLADVASWISSHVFRRVDHISEPTARSDAGKPIVLDGDGRINDAFIDWEADLANAVHTAPAITPLVDADEFLTLDSADGYSLARTLWSTIKSTLAATAMTWTAVHTFAGLIINGAAETSRILAYRTAGVNRWLMQVSSTAESGSNTGSDYQILSRADNGAALRTDLIITRSNGLWTLVGDINMAKTSPEFVFLNPTNQAIGSGTALGRLVFSVDDNSSGRVREEGAYLKYEGTGTWDGTSAPAKLSFGIRSSASGFTDDVMTIAQNGDVAFAGSLQSPTIVTPTIVSFANANHNHTNAAGGGTLTSSAISDFAEAVSDQAGSMFTGNTETGVVVTYQDSDNTIDVVLANMAQATVKGRASGAGTGAPVDLTADQLAVILNTSTSTLTPANILMGVGGTVTLASGGLDFGHFGATALTYYGTGTWTPTLTFGGGSTGIAYSTRDGYYTRIGNRVRAYCAIALSSKGTSTGQAEVSGLPFTVARSSAFDCRWANLATPYINIWAVGSGTSVILRGITAASTMSGNSSSFQDTAWNNNSTLTFEIQYEV